MTSPELFSEYYNNPLDSPDASVLICIKRYTNGMAIEFGLFTTSQLWYKRPASGTRFGV
jgi:hypothetical protein